MIRLALLALLRQQGDYGYNLKRRFDARVGSCWQLNIGQVYQTLHALRRSGLVVEIEGDDVPVSGRNAHPPRRKFEVTPKGQRSLERWIRRAPAAPRPVRDELLVRLFACDESQTADFLARLDEQEARHRRLLTRLIAHRQRSSPRDYEGLVLHLNLDGAVRHAEAHLQWLKYCRECLLIRPEAGGDTAAVQGGVTGVQVAGENRREKQVGRPGTSGRLRAASLRKGRLNRLDSG